MSTWVSDIWNSLNNDKPGASGRKISAAICVLTSVYIAIRQIPQNEKIYTVYAFLIFAAVCLGLVTIPELIKFLSAKGFIKENTEEKKIMDITCISEIDDITILINGIEHLIIPRGRIGLQAWKVNDKKYG